MAKKKYYGSSNYNPGVFKFGNAGMPQESFRRAFPGMPRFAGGYVDDSIKQIDSQMKSDMKPLRKGKLLSKY